jgi:hypothetical protein
MKLDKKLIDQSVTCKMIIASAKLELHPIFAAIFSVVVVSSECGLISEDRKIMLEMETLVAAT